MGARYELDDRQAWWQPPLPVVSLIVTLNGSLHVDGQRVQQAWVGGLGGRCAHVEAGPVHTSIDVKLTPLGFFALSRRSPRELTNACVDLGDVFGPGGRELENRLLNTRDWTARFAEVDRFLLLRAREPALAHPMALQAWSALRRTHGSIRIDALAAELGYSRRHFTAVFHDQVGLPPKTVARLLRFQRACTLIRANPARWADIATETGYCDQAHLNRDFRELAGTTPSRFLSDSTGWPAPR
jgi:AraC-like DNA-binding protein